jgi:putative oxidoreductase
MFGWLMRTDDSAVLFFNRLAFGLVMFPHGAQKALGWYGGPGFQKTMQTFTADMGIPYWLALLVIFFEFAGSLGLILGFLTRFFALGLTTSLVTCAFMFHMQNGFFMNWMGGQKGEGFEYHILVLGLAAGLLLKGGGFLSFDRALTRSESMKEMR